MEVEDKKEEAKIFNIAETLREARDKLSLNSYAMAAALNLDIEVINKIESNNFDTDIPTAFLRGYIKSYAAKVG